MDKKKTSETTGDAAEDAKRGVGEMRVYSRPGDSDPSNDPDIDYRAEGSDPYLHGEKRSSTDEGYDEAAHSGMSRYGTAEGAGGVFGTTGGGSYEGGFQVEERPGLYDREGEAPPSEGEGSGRAPHYGRDPEHFDEVMDSQNSPSPDGEKRPPRK